MKTLLTPILLDFLIIEGYDYCLLKIPCINAQDARETITLIPIKGKRILNPLTDNPYRCLPIDNEPALMAEGYFDAVVMVEIDNSDLKRYINFFMHRLSAPKQIFKPNTTEEC